MQRSFSFSIIPAFCVAGILLVLPACSGRSGSNPNARVEKPIPIAMPQPSPAIAAAPAPKLPPPTQDEVKAAFHRVFGDDFISSLADPNGPTFIVGDFNGDQSEDLALIARPAAGKLDDVNSELANWIIQDADKAFIPPPGKTVVAAPKQQRSRVEAGESVLAVIHGVGTDGWRNPEARQAYIVKHAAATFEGTAPSISQKAIRAMHLPVETEIIKEVRNNKKGFVFWTGGVYAWHPSEG
jgi:hypothetical protein